jgi:5'-3' exonuclease
VRVLTFSRQFGETVLYDEAAIQERYGLTPRQLIDFKSLKGDPSDNIPGVAGIGEKTATKLLQQYGTLENIYAHLDELDAKVREKLVAGKAQAEQGKQLVTIVTDVPIQLDLDACRLGQIDRERVTALFRELGFRTSLLERLPDAKGRESARKDAKEDAKEDAKGNAKGDAKGAKVRERTRKRTRKETRKETRKNAQTIAWSRVRTRWRNSSRDCAPRARLPSMSRRRTRMRCAPSWSALRLESARARRITFR